MRLDARLIDAGVREVVEALSRIPGVTTRASCEGAGHEPTPHRHADLAYVVLRYPLPLRFEEFLLARTSSIARIEDDGVFSRWPSHNRAFLDALLVAAQSYQGQQVMERRASLRWPLPRLSAHAARQLSSTCSVRVQLCLLCGDLTFGEHTPAHHPFPLLRPVPDQATVWFAEFVAQPRNALDTALVEQAGWVNLIARTHRGDFGTPFQRRWLRYRARMLADLATRQMRAGMELARRQRPDVDFFYTGTHAVFEWQPESAPSSLGRGPR